MLITVDNPAEKVFSRWSDAIKESTKVGNNVSMDMSRVPSSFPYIRMSYLGGVQVRGDLEGDECATTITFQIESFSSGQKRLTDVYALDDASHKIMVSMGFRRTYNGQVENIDEGISRVISRYSRLYAGKLLGEE